MIDIDSYILWLQQVTKTSIEFRESADPYFDERVDQEVLYSAQNVRRRFELDIDLQIIRAAKRHRYAAFGFLQFVRKQTLGSVLNPQGLFKE